jgi:hypothetical protein
MKKLMQMGFALGLTAFAGSALAEACFSMGFTTRCSPNAVIIGSETYEYHGGGYRGEDVPWYEEEPRADWYDDNPPRTLKAPGVEIDESCLRAGNVVVCGWR